MDDATEMPVEAVDSVKEAAESAGTKAAVDAALSNATEPPSVPEVPSIMILESPKLDAAIPRTKIKKSIFPSFRSKKK